MTHHAMTHHAMTRRTITRTNLARLSTLLLLTLTQCVCQNGSRDVPPSTTAPSATHADKQTNKPATETDRPAAEVGVPAGVDATDLDEDERAVLVSVLKEQFDPCGEPRSFYDSLSDPKTCDRARAMGTFVVTSVAKGLSKRQIVGLLLRELARTTTKAEFDTAGVPVWGDPGAPHAIVEFIDFQCPFCKEASEPVKKLAETFPLKVYVKNLPLIEHHPFAQEAAIAALAAHRQDKYFEAVKALFANQTRLDSQVIRESVASTGIDMTRWEADIKDPEIAKAIARDVAEADRYQLEGTPTFFLNGFMVEYDQLEQKLTEAVAEAAEAADE